MTDEIQIGIIALALVVSACESKGRDASKYKRLLEELSDKLTAREARS